MPSKEELKADYKQNRHRLRRMGVYQIRNLSNGKVLVDGSLNLDGAMERDRKWLDLGNHFNLKLKQDLKALGPGSFVVEELESLTPTDDPRDYRSELAILLEAWVEKLQPYGDKGYHSHARA